MLPLRTKNVVNEPVDLAKEVSRKDIQSAHWFLLAAHDKVL